MLVQDAAPPAGPVMDEQLVRAGGTGEPADGGAGQAQLGGDIAEAAPLGQHPVHVGVAAPRAVRDLSGARDSGRRGRRWRRRRDRGCGLPYFNYPRRHVRTPPIAKPQLDPPLPQPRT